MDEILLMLPGPTTVHPRVLNAMSQAVVNHRGAKYGEILTETSELMSDVFQTSNQSYLLTGSGTAAMEAAISNVRYVLYVHRRRFRLDQRFSLFL